MNDLVVGGAGFIGSQLCDALLNEGHKVVCVDNLLRGTKENIKGAIGNERFLFIEGDATDEELLIDILRTKQIDYVYHLAANSDIQASANDPSIEFSATCTTTWKILSAMRQCGVKKIFFASTSALYGEMEPGHPFSESSPMNPISYYGASKMASEAFLSAFSYMNDMDALIFRFPNVIGRRLTHGVIFDFITRLKKNPEQLIVLGDGTQTKPYIFSDDLIRAIMMLAPTNKKRNVYEIGVEGASSVRFIAESCVKAMRLDHCKILYGKSNVGWKGDVPVFKYDYSKILKTGWKPSMNSDQAVVATIDAFVNGR